MYIYTINSAKYVKLFIVSAYTSRSKKEVSFLTVWNNFYGFTCYKTNFVNKNLTNLC